MSSTVQNLFHTLQDYDLGHLRVIAEHWGLDLPPGSSLEMAKFISDFLSSEEFLSELEESLPKPTHEVLRFIIEQEGRTETSLLVRSFGEIRDMGPGRRDREKPWRNPISPVEDLWYRGLCAKSFIDTPTGAQEIVFIPDEILMALHTGDQTEIQPMGHHAPAPSEIVEAHSLAACDVTTLLAYLRKSPLQSLADWDQSPRKYDVFFQRPQSTRLLLSLLVDLGVINRSPLNPEPAATKVFLELSPFQILRSLFSAWVGSTDWNDLANVTGLSASNDEWPNDPLVSRQTILHHLDDIPTAEWWDLEGFIRDFRTYRPSFQRPAGDFDSWYLLGGENGAFLRGYKNWDHIEGELIRYLLSGPLHWLGITDLGRPPQSDRVAAFRLTALFKPFMHPEGEMEGDPSEGTILLLPDGLIRAARDSDNTMRYQIARFTEWVSLHGEEYVYRITPNSLQLAADQGLGVEHFQSILNAACENVPPTVSKALLRWGDEGLEAGVERSYILRVKDSALLESLQTNPRFAKYILEILSPTTAIIRAGSQTKLYKAAAQIGLFIDLAKDDYA